MRKSDSMEWNNTCWVSDESLNEAGDDDGNGDEDKNMTRAGSLESEEEEDEGDDWTPPPKLLRTSPAVDWFALEAAEVAGFQDNDEESDFGKTMFNALQTLAVVFGDIGISPLYTFDIMFNKCPINGEEDVIGALSLVLYTLILIPLVKYVFVVLWANDDGEGGTFALYSLICRYAKVSLVPNHHPSGTHTSGFGLKVPTTELAISLKVKESLESSLFLKKMLLGLVLFGTSMVLSNGVVTPIISVMSAVSGFKLGAQNFGEDKVVMISVAFLVVLFSIQKYATSKVGLVIGPSLLMWFFSIGIMGIWNVSIYGTAVLKAFNPVNIYYYFERNSFKAWLSLGGCLLCSTGAEAIFADLCYFSVRSVQLTFVFLVLPSLLLCYLGQAAFLVANQTTSNQIFFWSLPGGTFWPIVFLANIAALIASRTMTTATFQCIKKSIALGCFPRLKIIHTSRKFMGQIYIPAINWFLLVSCFAFLVSFGDLNEIGNAYAIAEVGVMMMTTILVTVIMVLVWQTNIFRVLSFVSVFLGLELAFFSSALTGIGYRSWLLLVFLAILLTIMSVWNYGSRLRYESEVKQKLSKNLMRRLGPDLGTVRAPGIGLVCNELIRGIPGIFGHFLTTLPAIHSMIVFVCVKYVPVSLVPREERFIFQRVCPRSYHMFRCIARYGYKDVRKEPHKIFENLLLDGLEKFIQREAVELSLQSDGDVDSDEEVNATSNFPAALNGSPRSLNVPLLAADYVSPTTPVSEPGTSRASPEELAQHYAQNLEVELMFIQKAKESGCIYLLGTGAIKARKDSCFVRKLIINYFYAFLRNNCRRGITTMSIPRSNLMQIRTTDVV